VEERRNAAGCYGLVICIVLVVAALAAIGMNAPEKNELNIEISAGCPSDVPSC
jgi:hypothetical protein